MRFRCFIMCAMVSAFLVMPAFFVYGQENESTVSLDSVELSDPDDMNETDDADALDDVDAQEVSDDANVSDKSGMNGSGNGTESGMRHEGTVYKTEKCGDSLTYSLIEDTDGNFTLVLEGEGAMYDYVYRVWNKGEKTAPWQIFLKNKRIKAIEIKEGITYIGSSAFYGAAFDSEVSLDLPEGITSIGEDAFECAGFTNITLPESLEKVGACAFYKTKIQSVKIPAKLTDIGDGAFHENYYLETITVDPKNKVYDSRDECNCLIRSKDDYLMVGSYKSTVPSGIKTIGAQAFEAAIKLDSITLPESLKTIEFSAFYGSRLKSIELPSKLTTIGEYAFGSSYITEIRIPDSVTTVEKFAFDRCKRLKTVIIGDGLKNLDEYLFQECTALSSVTFGASIAAIDENAFYGTYNIREIIVSEKNKTFDSRDNCNALIETATNTLYYGCRNTVIPESVKAIGEHAFLRNYVQSIEFTDSLESIGFEAFALSQLTSVMLPESLEQMGNYCFSLCRHLNEAILPENLTAISNGAFNECSGLVSVTIGKNVKSIGEYAFDECTGLKYVYFTGTKEEWNAIQIGPYNDALLKAKVIFNSPSYRLRDKDGMRTITPTMTFGDKAHKFYAVFTQSVTYDTRAKVQKSGTSKKDVAASLSKDPSIDFSLYIDDKKVDPGFISVRFKNNKKTGGAYMSFNIDKGAFSDPADAKSFLNDFKRFQKIRTGAFCVAITKHYQSAEDELKFKSFKLKKDSDGNVSLKSVSGVKLLVKMPDSTGVKSVSLKTGLMDNENNKKNFKCLAGADENSIWFEGVGEFDFYYTFSYSDLGIKVPTE